MLKGFILGVVAVIVVLPILALACLGAFDLLHAPKDYKEEFFECNAKRLEAEYKLSHPSDWRNLPDVKR